MRRRRYRPRRPKGVRRYRPISKICNCKKRIRRVLMRMRPDMCCVVATYALLGILEAVWPNTGVWMLTESVKYVGRAFVRYNVLSYLWYLCWFVLKLAWNILSNLVSLVYSFFLSPTLHLGMWTLGSVRSMFSSLLWSILDADIIVIVFCIVQTAAMIYIVRKCMCRRKPQRVMKRRRVPAHKASYSIPTNYRSTFRSATDKPSWKFWDKRSGWQNYDKYSNEKIESKWQVWHRAARCAIENDKAPNISLARFDLKISFLKTVTIDLQRFVQKEKSGNNNVRLIVRLPPRQNISSTSTDVKNGVSVRANNETLSAPPLLRCKSSGPAWSAEARLGCRHVAFTNESGKVCSGKVYPIPRPSPADDAATTRSLDLEHFSKAAFQFCNLTNKPPSSIIMVDAYVENEEVEKRFYDTKRRFRKAYGEKGHEIWVFHGTQSDNIARIMVEGFKVGGIDVRVKNGSAYGKGVYTATGPSTPISYAKNCRCVILARALVGKHKRVVKRDVKAHNFDTWSPQVDWKVFRSGSQLLPRYVVYYQ